MTAPHFIDPARFLSEQLNQRIRALRVAEGTVDDDLTLTGMDGLLIGKGDVIQTRRNDSELQGSNRQTWTVRHVDRGGVWVRELGAGANARTVALPAEYVAASAHLAYAVTTYGVQGATVDRPHTVLSDATSAAGVYVGMTRGRQANQPHIVAANLDDAREQFTAALERDRADRGLAHATGRAAEQVRGLTADGPVKLVNAARALLASRVAEERQEEARLRREAARGREPGHVRLHEAHAEA